MNRTSNHQLLALLQSLERAASADHPLSEMFRGFIKNALLDLRDSRAEIARLRWYVRHMDQHIKRAKDEAMKAVCESDPRKAHPRWEQVNHLICAADSGCPAEIVMQDAIKPMTGKEK